MRTTDVVADANVALKWFHATGEEGVAAARALVDAHASRTVALAVLDLTAYEVGNALLRGRARAGASEIAQVLAALGEICPAVGLSAEQWRAAAELAERHQLTLYDAAYAAVARSRGAVLVTFDRALLDPGLGERPEDLLGRLGAEQ